VTDQSLPVDPQYLTVATDGEPLSFTAAVSGGAWLAAAPALGIAVAGSPVTLAVSVTTAGLLPGAYTGKITLTSANASNKSAFVTVLLTVGPGMAVVSSIWPNAAPIGSNDQTITIRGSHLFKASVVQAGTTALTTTWIATDAMLAVIPKASLLAPAALGLTVTNAPQPASIPDVNSTFTVTPLGPLIQAVGTSVGVVNAASFKIDSPTPLIAPGEILSIFGSGLGPTVLVQSTPVAGVFPTTVGTPAAKVEFGTVSGTTCGTLTAAPIIFAQANQINAVAPFALTSASGQCLLVTYNSISSALVPFTRVTANPGLFTIDSSGRGQAAAFNYDAVKGYTLNSAANPAPKDSIVVLYGTGGGVTSPLPTAEGQVIPTTGAVPTVVGVPTLTVGGEAASVQSITAVPGSIAGLMQLNVLVPSTVKAAKDAAVVISIGGQSSSAYATLAVK